MWIGIICIIGQMRILNRWELYHFNIRGPLIFGAALSTIMSLVHIWRFWRSLDWASLRKLSAKRSASINGRRALACSHQHVDATRRCITPLCSVFKASDEWYFWRKVDRTRRPCSLVTSFARSNITRLLFMGFCQRTSNGGGTYHAWRHEKEYAEHVPKLHHYCWLKLDSLFISELRSAYKWRVITSSIFCR